MNNPFFLGLLFFPLLLSCSGSLHDGGRRTVHAEVQNISNPENGTYRIENEWVRLAEGRAETKIVPGASSKTVTTLFAQPVYGDLDGNGEADAALLLVQQSGGSGSFFMCLLPSMWADRTREPMRCFLETGLHRKRSRSELAASLCFTKTLGQQDETSSHR